MTTKKKAPAAKTEATENKFSVSMSVPVRSESHTIDSIAFRLLSNHGDIVVDHDEPVQMKVPITDVMWNSIDGMREALTMVRTTFKLSKEDAERISLSEDFLGSLNTEIDDILSDKESEDGAIPGTTTITGGYITIIKI